MDGREAVPKTALGETAGGGANGVDSNHYNTGPSLRGLFRLSPVGICRPPRYRRYSADYTHRLFAARARGIVIFPPPCGRRDLHVRVIQPKNPASPFRMTPIFLKGS